MKKQFFNTYRFILLVRKGVYPYDYMDDWAKFNETSLTENEFLRQTKHGRYYCCSLRA